MVGGRGDVRRNVSTYQRQWVRMAAGRVSGNVLKVVAQQGRGIA